MKYWNLLVLLLIVSPVDLSRAEVKMENNDVIISSVRQLANGMKMMRDLILLGAMGLPFLAMVGLGSLALAPYVRPLRNIRPNFKQQMNEDGMLPRRRTLSVQDHFDAVSHLEEVFAEYDIKEPECRLRAICEVYQYSLKGEPMDRIVHFIRVGRRIYHRSASPPEIYLHYREAVRSGLAKQDCSKIYGQCSKSLFFYIRNKSEVASLSVGES